MKLRPAIFIVALIILSIPSGTPARPQLFRDTLRPPVSCFSFERSPDTLWTRGDSGRAFWRLTLPPEGTAHINYALALGEKDSVVHKLATDWASHFTASLEKVKTDWQRRFDAMFTHGNSLFSGHLPVVVTPDTALKRTYYMSALSLLSVMRTGFPVAPRVYVSNTPESNCTMMYFWDTREWATTLALLDPLMLKEYLRAWLSRGIYRGYAEEYLTGTLQSPWDSANDLSVFILLNDYLNVTGDNAFLSERVNDRTILQHMDSIATHWKALVRPGRTLADYGDASNLLECVPTYIHEVAVTADGSSRYSVFVAANGKRSVVVVNQESSRPIEARLGLQNRGTLLAATPEAPEAQPTAGTLIIPARSAVVVMEQ